LNTDKQQLSSSSLLRFTAALVMFFLFALHAHAQTTDTSTVYKEEPAAPKLPPPAHSPKKAAILSAVLPGLGQIYNHKYWKVPVIYAAGVGLGYFFAFEQQQYTYYNNAYQQRTSGNAAAVDPALAAFDNYRLLSDKDYYNHYRDLAVIGMSVLYVLNVLDAAVDAHLWHFKEQISDNLSIHLRPALNPVYGMVLPAPGLRLSLRLH
jgi:hypothetical protein